MISKVKKRTGWDRIDELVINGNYYPGRNCIARHEGKEYKFYVNFGDEVEIQTFLD
jgi:hypothetical protein